MRRSNGIGLGFRRLAAGGPGLRRAGAVSGPGSARRPPPVDPALGAAAESAAAPKPRSSWRRRPASRQPPGPPGSARSPATGAAVLRLEPENLIWVAPGIVLRDGPSDERGGARHPRGEVAKVPYEERRGDFFRIRHARQGGLGPPARLRPGRPGRAAARQRAGQADAADPREPGSGAPGARPRPARRRGNAPAGWGLSSSSPTCPRPRSTCAWTPWRGRPSPPTSARYRRYPVGEAEGAIVLFADEGAYRVPSSCRATTCAASPLPATTTSAWWRSTPAAAIPTTSPPPWCTSWRTS